MVVQADVNARSELAITDEGTKTGTKVDGEKIEKGSTRILKKLSHDFQPGHLDQKFR